MIPQPLLEIATLTAMEEFPAWNRCLQFTVEMKGEPAYALPVEAKIDFSVPIESCYSARVPSDAIRSALVEAMPADFFPTWSPV